MGNSGGKVSTELNESKLEELMKKTGLSSDEIRRMHAEFLRDCPSGKLDKKQFTNIYKQLYPSGNATKFCNICFAAYDKDKSGYIDFYEFITAMGILSKGKIEDKLKLAFDIYDYNDDGFIEKKEAETIVSSLFLMYGEDTINKNLVKSYVDKLMNKFDADNNGLLSEKEFVEGCMNDQDLRQFFAPLCK